MKPFVNMDPLLLVLLMGVSVARVRSDNTHVTDFVSSLMDKNAHKRVVYLVVDCHSPGPENAIEVIENLVPKLTRSSIHVMTIPVSRNVSHPQIFTSNLSQLLEALQNYACISSITDGRPPKVKGLLSAILSTSNQMDRKDVMLVFPVAEDRDEMWPPSLTPQLRDKQISVNVILDGNSKNIDQYAGLVHTTGGRIFTYNTRLMDHERTSVNLTPKSELSTSGYTVKAVRKENLEQDTRTVFALPEGTSQIFMTLNGSVRKALLISQSGVIINIASQEGLPSSLGSSRSDSTAPGPAIGFKLPISRSPADWTFVASGDKYHVTMIIVTKAIANNHMHQSDDTGDFTANDGLQLRSNFQSNPNFTNTNPGAEALARRQDYSPPAGLAGSQSRTDWRAADLFVDPVKYVLPTEIDVDPLSTFYAFPGEEAQMVFNVRNNKIIPSMYFFDCFYAQQPCFVRPGQVHLAPQQRVKVYVTVRADGLEGSSNVVALISESVEITVKKVHVYIGKQRSDNRKPDIDFEYNGNCDEANTGGTCHRRRWSANVIAKDYESGLLNFWSEPMGLVYTSEFVVGTRDAVTARFTASCCDPKVDILASDLRGNTHRVTLNVEHQYLSAIEIIAIVLGAVLLILILIAIIYGIIRWRRRRNERLFLSNS